MTIKIEGLDELLENLEFKDKDLTPQLQKACALVERDAKQLAPKGTGELRRSITSKVEGSKGIVYTPLLYAPYIEYGTGLFAENGGRKDVPWVYKDDEGNWHSTSGMKPHPFLRKAVQKNSKKIVKIIKEGILND